MTRQKALKILGLHNDDDKDEIKKRYRRIMKQIHPDASNNSDYPYDASEINLAYEALMNNTFTKASNMDIKNGKDRNKPWEDNSDKPTGSNSIRWNAKTNSSAYCERNIYINVEDSEGIIGQAIIDTGKYIWSIDEEFSLFLKSLYECSKKVISCDGKEERASDIELQAEIAYLLAEQFVDTDIILNNSSIVGLIKENIYLADAMVEDIDPRICFSEGEYLFPGRLSRHRLYIKNDKNIEVGYLSFKDDRLYYGIIPLFERRTVQVKIQVTDSLVKKQRGRNYIDVSLMIKRIPEDVNQVAHSINEQIKELLS